MAYCRFSPESDVYLFSNGVRFCFIAKKGDDLDTVQEFSTLGFAPTISSLMRLHAEGYRFPRSALDRLVKEHRELMIEVTSGES